MDLLKEIQCSEVADEVSATVAVVIPILKGLFSSIKKEAIQDAGGFENVKLRQLPRLYRPGDGDVGISFEYAVHEAIINNDPKVLERIDAALNDFCKIRGEHPSSILFGAEKSGTIQIIESVKDHLTDESRLLSGSKGQPVRLKKHIDAVAAAFRKQEVRESLPNSINGLWKADLFVGQPHPDQWVGTTVKINPSQLEHARGLRIGVVPSKQGRSDKVYKHDTKNLIVCPLPYDGSFMEIFYQGWAIVRQFISADAILPKEVNLPKPADRQVCRFLEERREFPVLDVLEALKLLAQPHLLENETEDANVFYRKGDVSTTKAVIAPISSL